MSKSYLAGEELGGIITGRRIDSRLWMELVTKKRLMAGIAMGMHFAGMSGIQARTKAVDKRFISAIITMKELW